MGLDADDGRAGTQIGVVARDTRVFAQVMQAIGDELERAFKQNHSGRTEAELLDIARTVQRPPMDAAVTFTVYAGAKKLAYTTDVYARITGRIVNVRTGQKIGGFEVTSPRSVEYWYEIDSDSAVE